MIFVRRLAVVAIIIALTGLLCFTLQKRERQQIRSPNSSDPRLALIACGGDRSLEDIASRPRHAEGERRHGPRDFTNATLTHHGAATTFSRDGDKFMCGPTGDGAPRAI